MTQLLFKDPQQSVTVELPPPWKDDLNSSPAIRMDEEPQRKHSLQISLIHLFTPFDSSLVRHANYHQIDPLKNYGKNHLLYVAKRATIFSSYVQYAVVRSSQYDGFCTHFEA